MHNFALYTVKLHPTYISPVLKAIQLRLLLILRINDVSQPCDNTRFGTV